MLHLSSITDSKIQNTYFVQFSCQVHQFHPISPVLIQSLHFKYNTHQYIIDAFLYAIADYPLHDA